MDGARQDPFKLTPTYLFAQFPSPPVGVLNGFFMNDGCDSLEPK